VKLAHVFPLGVGVKSVQTDNWLQKYICTYICILFLTGINNFRKWFIAQTFVLIGIQPQLFPKYMNLDFFFKYVLYVWDIPESYWAYILQLTTFC